MLYYLKAFTSNFNSIDNITSRRKIRYQHYCSHQMCACFALIE